MDKDVEQTIKLISALNDFWNVSNGWAPNEAYLLLQEARLDRQLSFAKTLPDYFMKMVNDTKEAKIIMGYATLRGMSESAIKLFYSVYIEDYMKEGNFKVDNKNRVIPPKKMQFDKLIDLYLKDGDASFESYLRRIQQRGNAIHHFKDREIGTQVELIEDIKKFKNFILAINDQLPYPYGYPTPKDCLRNW